MASVLYSQQPGQVEGSLGGPSVEDRGSLVPASVLVALAAEDTGLFNREFFPRAFRQKSPAFHYEIFDLLEDPRHRLVALKIFRDGAKTTLLRAYVAKRISYGISRTILFVSASQGHSVKSLAWVKRQVEYNRKWTQIFGLAKGSKWTDDVIEVQHQAFNEPIVLIALGITGQVRGINVNDYRPDLIVIDDPCDEENTATEEGRRKTENLVFGALLESLAPATEAPDAKLALLQTPLHPQDLISRATLDSSFASRTYGILDEQGLSRWPDRYPTETVLKDKAQAIERNQLPLWTREKMCRIISEETADFRPEWLRFWDVLPENMMTVVGIDPVPPPSEREMAVGLKGKDYEVLAVVGYSKGNYYLCAYERNHGHQPDWTIAKFFELADRFKPLRARAEGVNYQRTLKWVLEKEMASRHRYLQINSVADRRGKRHRIVQALNGIASQGRLFIARGMTEFQEQFCSYPSVDHDDVLDAVAMALDELAGAAVGEMESAESDEDYSPLSEWRDAP